MKSQKPITYTCEEAIIVALQNCDDKEAILEGVELIKKIEVKSNDMGADEFVTKFTSLEYCQGCQAYHNTEDTEFVDGSCKVSREEMINIHLRRVEQEQKRREDNEYLHR